MSKLSFSVEMCVYGKDNPAHFKTAVESIVNQTVPPNEIVLVVDGPIPKELDDVIIPFEKSEIFNVIRLKENQGLGNARRIGIAACKNELVAMMDADDVSCADRFEQQLQCFMADPEIVVLGGDMTEFIGDENNVISKREVPVSDEEIKKYAKKRCPFNHVTVMLKKSEIEKVGGYQDFHFNEDYFLWVRLQIFGAKFANTGTVLVNVRTGEDQYARRGGLKYFKSELTLQKYMKKNKMIGFWTYTCNVIKRFIGQCLLPNKLRGWVYKKFLRK